MYASATFSIPSREDTFVVYAAVANSAGTARWEWLNSGTSFVCQPLEIPDPDYTSLGCQKWDH